MSKQYSKEKFIDYIGDEKNYGFNLYDLYFFGVDNFDKEDKVTK